MREASPIRRRVITISWCGQALGFGPSRIQSRQTDGGRISGRAKKARVARTDRPTCRHRSRVSAEFGGSLSPSGRVVAILRHRSGGPYAKHRVACEARTPFPGRCCGRAVGYAATRVIPHPLTPGPSRLTLGRALCFGNSICLRALRMVYRLLQSSIRSTRARCPQQAGGLCLVAARHRVGGLFARLTMAIRLRHIGTEGTA